MRIQRMTLVGFAAVCGIALLTAGCNPTVATRRPNGKSSSTTQQVDELTMAVDALRQLSDPNGAEAGQRVVFYLNQWISKQPVADSGWSRDKLLDRIPNALKGTPGLQDLERPSFDERDLPYLQQNVWLYDIAQRVRRNPPPEYLAEWLREIEKSAGIRESEQLAAATHAFDWTIRNIQLDEMPPEPKAAAATAGAGDPAANLPSVRGEIGPGYGHLPLQVMLYGHGDAWERSRVFLLLARQLGIEGVMLAVADPQSTGSSRPWVCALVLGKELYLFDAELGLPIPGPERKGIATLSQVVAEPELLEALDVEGGPQYRVSADELKQIVALIDAEPAALSLRMTLLERGMPPSRRIYVSCQPSELQQQLRGLSHIGQTSLWRVPFEAQLFADIGLGQWLQQNAEAREQYIREANMFNGQNAMLQARNLQFLGRFESVDQEPGARTIYLANRPPDKTIEKIATSTAVRDQMGLSAQLPEDPKARSEALENFVTNARHVKQCATYWLGLTYFETGDYGVTAEWLGERTLEASPRSPWQDGARYNLARSYEALGQLDQAAELFAADDSPQRHGNLLRGQWLEQRIKSADDSSSTAPLEDKKKDVTESKTTASDEKSKDDS